MATAAPAVALRGIRQALRRGAGQRRRRPHGRAAGTVHGIVGENGAGRATLMSILYGLVSADSGVDRGQRRGRCRSATRATRSPLGIGMVHQHFMLVDTFTCARERAARRRAAAGCCSRGSRAGARRDCRALIARQRPAGATSMRPSSDACRSASASGVEILKALYRGARILILDEPTAVLTPQETDQLFGTLRSLRAQRHDDRADHPQAQGNRRAHRRGDRDARGRVVLDCATADTTHRRAGAGDGRPARADGPRPARPSQHRWRSRCYWPVACRWRVCRGRNAARRRVA
mgnify:CR=1 FL=1